MTKREFLSTIEQYNPNYDMDIISRAYDVAEEMHRNQLRKSGEEYLIHPLAVAEILAELGMDSETIAAGLLHDVIEDTSYTVEDMTRDFGAEVTELVDGVTKLSALKFESKEERQAENLRKMFLAMSKDIRVLIIKLADRLHNLRTINYMTHEKIIEKCQETLDIYAPLAARLGIYSMKMELEDIALKFLDPAAYYDLAEQVSQRKGERESAINEVVDEIAVYFFCSVVFHFVCHNLSPCSTPFCHKKTARICFPTVEYFRKVNRAIVTTISTQKLISRGSATETGPIGIVVCE